VIQQHQTNATHQDGEEEHIAEADHFDALVHCDRDAAELKPLEEGAVTSPQQNKQRKAQRARKLLEAILPLT
jgi:hypothetical protein